MWSIDSYPIHYRIGYRTLDLSTWPEIWKSNIRYTIEYYIAYLTENRRREKPALLSSIMHCVIQTYKISMDQNLQGYSLVPSTHNFQQK